jgi:hypothetical protein
MDLLLNSFGPFFNGPKEGIIYLLCSAVCGVIKALSRILFAIVNRELLSGFSMGSRTSHLLYAENT